MDLLTPDEVQLMNDISKVTGGFRRICGEGPVAKHDIAEIIAHIHALQNWVLAQAAARAYPDEYRLMGDSFVTARTPNDRQDLS